MSVLLKIVSHDTFRVTPWADGEAWGPKHRFLSILSFNKKVFVIILFGMMSIYQREISKKSPTRQTWKIRSMSYMGDSVHNVCQKGCMNINWKSLFTKSILFEIHITCIDDYHNALCSGCLNCNWNIMSFRRGVWISTWIAYSSSLDYLNFTLPVLKVNIMSIMQWVYEFQLECYFEGVYEFWLE